MDIKDFNEYHWITFTYYVSEDSRVCFDYDLYENDWNKLEGYDKEDDCINDLIDNNLIRDLSHVGYGLFELTREGMIMFKLIEAHIKEGKTISTFKGN